MKRFASAALALAGLLALAIFAGQSGSAQTYTPAYYPVPVIETVAGEANAFRLRIMRCAKTREACSSSELTQPAEYRAGFGVEISGAAGGLIWADHATRPSWSGSLCSNQSGRTPARTCTTDNLSMLQADDVADNRAATAAVAAELFRFAPPPGRLSMTITVKLSGGAVTWANRVYQTDGNGNVLNAQEPPYYPLINEALTTATRTLSFTETMAEASRLRDARGRIWDFVRVNGESRYWARDAIYFKIGVSDDYMVHQASTITVSGPAGSFIKPAPGPAEDADCTARTTEAAMNSCELTPVAQASVNLRHLTLRPPSGTERRERLMLFSPPASGSGTATITVRIERPQGTSSPAVATASIPIRYGNVKDDGNLSYAYPVPKLLSTQDLTPAEQAAERAKYAERMNLGSYGNPLVRWEREPFSNAQLIPGDSLLTAFVGIDARDGEELELVGTSGESPEPTGVFDSYLPWWGDDTAAPGDAGLCAVGPTNQYAYAPCRDSNTLGVLRTTLLPASTMAQVIARQTAEAGGTVKWSIPQQSGTGWEMPASVPASPGRTTTFGLKEMRSPGDGSGVKLVTRAATGTVSLSAARQANAGSASNPEFHRRFDGSLSTFTNDGDTIGVFAGPKATLTVPAGRQLEAACIHRLTSLTSVSDSLLRVYSGVNVIERGMYDFAHGDGHYDLDYYERFYGFTAATRPSHTDRTTGTRPKHPFCTDWTIEGRYDVMRHQRYLAVGNTAEITAAALAAGSGGTTASLALPAWSTGSRHIFVAVPDSVGDVVSLGLAGGQTLAESDLNQLPNLEIGGVTYKVWHSVGTVPQSASGATVAIEQQSPSILKVEGPAYWRTAETVADPSNPSKRSQVLPIGYGTPYELLTCEQPGKQGGDVLCKVVDLQLNPPQLVLDTTQSDSTEIKILGRLHGIRGRSLEVAWGLAGSNWQGRAATANAQGIQNLLTDPGGPDGPGGGGGTGFTLFGDAQGSASAVSLAASLADDADQVLQETDDRALRIGPTATVTASAGKDIAIGCIQTFGSSSPATVTWMRTGAGANEAPACAYDDLLDGRNSYLTITGPATWKSGGKRLAIGTGTDFPVVQCDDVTDEDGNGEWLASCAVKSGMGAYPRLVVDDGAPDGSTIKIVANFAQSGTAPERTGWRISWREGTGRTPSTGWASHPPVDERLASLFATASFPVRDIAGIGSVALEREGGRTLPAPADWNEGLLVRVRNGEGNPAESEDISSISLITTGGSLDSDWCPAGTSGCTLDMPELRSSALAKPSLTGAIPVNLHTPDEAGTVTVTAAVVSATAEPFEAVLDVPVRGPADAVVVGDDETPPAVHHHATPNDDRDVVKFDERAFDRLTQGTGFPEGMELRIYDSAGVRRSAGFTVSEECPSSDRLSCRAVVRVIAPPSDPVPTGRYRLEASDGAGRTDAVEFLVVSGAARIEPVGRPWRGLDVGQQFDLAVLIMDENGLPVADGTLAWFAVRTRFANDDTRGVAVTLGHPLPGDTVETLGGKTSARMSVAGEEVALATAFAGGVFPEPEALRTIVINTRETGCDGDFVADAVRAAVAFGDGLLTRWSGADGCPASGVRTLLDDGWRIHLYAGLMRNWPYYAERDGRPVPGSMDFFLRPGDLILVVPPR